MADLTDDQLADCVPADAVILEHEGQRNLVAMTRTQLHDFARAVLAASAAPSQPVASATHDAAYDQIDRFLRNNLDDADYADYSAALDTVALGTTPQPPSNGNTQQPVAWFRPGATEPISDALKRADPTFYEHYVNPAWAAQPPSNGEAVEVLRELVAIDDDQRGEAWPFSIKVRLKDALRRARSIVERQENRNVRQ